MTIRIVCVGRIKEAFYREAAAEYLKRLTRYAKTEVIEVGDEKTPDHAPAAEEEIILSREGARILGKIRPSDYVIALAIKGRSFDSVAFSKHLDALALGGKSTLVFVIGGSLGLSRDVLQRADECVSFSAMTFPHQLMRVILLEQLYRAARISAGEPYHK